MPSAEDHDNILRFMPSRVARLFWYNIPKRENKPNYHKIPQNVPNGSKMLLMAITYVHIPTYSIPRPSKIYPNRDFWFENILSGNPDAEFVCNSRGPYICSTFIVELR
jgi:hypothetical protein